MSYIESLESRQLLSASLHPAAKPKPTIPNIAFEFTGIGTETKPVHGVGDLVLNITSESSKGILAGTFTNTTTDRTGNFTGKITTKDAVTIKVLGTTNKVFFTFTGKYSSLVHQITGKFKGAGSKGAKPTSGTFSLSSNTT
jgi:hypothetical protein